MVVIYLARLVYIKLQQKEKYSYPKLQIKASGIHGDGVFADRIYNTGDVILEDIFPNTPPGFDLYKMSEKEFNKYLSLHGKKINHCGKNFNSDLVKRDKKYKLVATKNIKKDDEVTANYNRVNKNYPFIAAADKKFASC